MLKTVKILFHVTLITLFLASCTSKDQLKAMLTDNPDILIEALTKNAEKLAPALNKVTMEAKKLAQGRSRENEAKQREEEYKNPKQPEVGAKTIIRGNVKAPVTIVGYSDFQCPYCSKVENTMEEIRNKYGDKVRYVFKNNPLAFHPLARPASQRYVAIAMQSKEKAFKFHDEVFKNQNALKTEKEALLDKIAAKVGANVAKMKKDMVSKAVNDSIDADMEEAKKFGLTGTPAFLVNGITLKGARPVSDFEEIIERWLNEGTREVAAEKPQ